MLKWFKKLFLRPPRSVPVPTESGKIPMVDPFGFQVIIEGPDENNWFGWKIIWYSSLDGKTLTEAGWSTKGERSLADARIAVAQELKELMNQWEKGLK